VGYCHRLRIGLVLGGQDLESAVNSRGSVLLWHDYIKQSSNKKPEVNKTKTNKRKPGATASAAAAAAATGSSGGDADSSVHTAAKKHRPTQLAALPAVSQRGRHAKPSSKYEDELQESPEEE
jgi:hypothetical protein